MIGKYTASAYSGIPTYLCQTGDSFMMFVRRVAARRKIFVNEQPVSPSALLTAPALSVRDRPGAE